MTFDLLIDALHRELRAASPDLVDNDDLLRGVLAGCGDCIKVLDLDGRLQFMSEGGKRVMEVDDFSALKGCPWPGFWAGEGNAQAVAAVEMAKAGGTGRFRGHANTAKGNLRYWDVQVSPIFGPDGRPQHLLSISRDITEEWQASQRQEEAVKRERFLTGELDHRVKNSFSMVMSVANQTFRGEAHAAQLQVFRNRVMTLARAHDAMNKSALANTPLVDALEAALAPHRTGEGKFTISGPELSIAPRQALSLTLAVNELATNAAKYGALSSPDGKVEIIWSTATDGVPVFNFLWREFGGPIVVKPLRQGFGSRVIRDFMGNDFGGTVELSYEPQGVVCQLTSPLQNLPG
jgi:two-component sensor histidine kinase